ncbi:hypothetical protein NUSPORA_02097 [Nucleospora cyclopteri]
MKLKKKRVKINEKINKIKVLSINVNNIKNKKIELQSLLNIFKPHLAFLQETHRKEGDSSWLVEEYKIIETLASDLPGINGLAILTRKDFVPYIKIKEIGDLYMSIQIFRNKDHGIDIGNVYRPCSGLDRNWILEKINKKMQKDKDFAVMGDWNTPENEIKNILKNAYCSNRNINSGTRVSNGIRTERKIDFMLANKKDLITDEIILHNWEISDHIPVLSIININPLKLHTNEKWIFDRERILNSHVKSCILNYDYKSKMSGSLSEEVERFTNEIKKILKEKGVIRLEKNLIKVPCKKITTLIKIRARTPDKETKTIISKKIKNECYLLKKRLFKNFIKKGIEYLKNANFRESWKFIKARSGLSKFSIGSTSLKCNLTGKEGTTDEDKCAIARNHFENLFSSDTKKGADPFMSNGTRREDTDQEITWEEIRTVLSSLRRYKAASRDGLPIEAYKMAAEDHHGNTGLASAILHIFNRIFKTGQIPDSWNKSTIVLIHKKGDRKNLNNYRGITLINTLLKTFMKVMNNRLLHTHEKSRLTGSHQIGFMPGIEGLSAVATLVEVAQRRMRNNLETWVAFLDLKKAFDLVPHYLLMKKLREKGIGEMFCKLIENIYEKTECEVRINDATFEGFSVGKGVRQGCPLSPILFDIFIDDLFSNMTPIQIPDTKSEFCGILFADDTLLISESVDEMKKKIVLVKKWLQENGMELNVEKSGIMRFPNSLETSDISFNDKKLPIVSRYVYLGIEINDSLDEKEMASFRCQKGWNTIELIKDTLRCKKTPLEYKRLLIKNVLTPRVTYGLALFGGTYTNVACIKKVVHKALTLVLGRVNFCISRVCEELNLMMLEAKAKYFKLKVCLPGKNIIPPCQNLLKQATQEKHIRELGSTKLLHLLKETIF